MRHGLKEDRKGIGTRIRAGNREGNWGDNGLSAVIYYYISTVHRLLIVCVIDLSFLLYSTS